MQTKTNKRMRNFSSALGGVKKLCQEPLDSRLRDLLEPGFVEIGGCVLLESQRKVSEAVRLHNFQDLTGYECFVNHIHVKDYISARSAARLSMVKQGLAFARQALERLSTSFPSKRFRVIVACNESDCNVRFHSIRVGENWLSDDLDKYEEEAVAVLEE